MKDDSIFTICNMVGMENDNPTLNRIVIEFNDILRTNMLNISRVASEQIGNTLFDTYKEIVKIERLLLQYYKITEDTIDKLEKRTKENYDINNFQWDNPSYQLEACFKDFLITCAVILRYRTKIAILIYDDNNLSDHDKLRKRINSELTLKKEKLGVKAYNCTIEMLKQDRIWIPELINFRNQAEHVENEKLNMTDFNFNLTKLTVNPPILKDINKYVHTYMTSTFYNIYTFYEDYIAMLFNLVLINNQWEVIKTVKQEPNVYKDKINDIGNCIYLLDMKESYKEQFSNL